MELKPWSGRPPSPASTASKPSRRTAGLVRKSRSSPRARSATCRFRVCATPWHATEGVGWVARLEEDWREARDELTAFLALLDEGGFVKPETALCPETGRFEKLVLCEDGSRAIETATRVGRDHFARTLALLRVSGAPLGPAPVSMNRQPPNSGLPPHSDNANFLLTGHLGLVVPDDGVCEFVMVDSEARRWREGGVLLADTSFVHATRNDGEADRVVLHFTVWHPDLAAAERGRHRPPARQPCARPGDALFLLSLYVTMPGWVAHVEDAPTPSRSPARPSLIEGVS